MKTHWLSTRFACALICAGLAAIAPSASLGQQPPSTGPAVPATAQPTPPAQPSTAQPTSELKPGDPSWLPERFVDADVLPIGDVTYELRDTKGESIRAVRVYRVSKAISRPELYVAWPVPILLHSPNPVPGMPDVVFNTETSEENPTITRVLLSTQLTTKELLEECRQEVIKRDRKYLEDNRVKDADVLVQSFPFSHAFVQFQIGGEDFVLAQTPILTAVSERVEFWIGLTGPQLSRLNEALKRNTLSMIWICQYKGVQPEMDGTINLELTKDIITRAAGGLNAEQTDGRAPVFKQEDQEQVAKNAIKELKISIRGNKAALPMLNVDGMIPELFKEFQGEDLERYLQDEKRATALAEYYKPLLQTLKTDETKNQVEIIRHEQEHVHNDNGGGGFGVSLGPISLGGGADAADMDRTKDSFEKTTGMATERIGTSQWYKPVKLNNAKLLQLRDVAGVRIFKDVYTKKSDAVRYVLDTTMPIKHWDGNRADPVWVSATRVTQLHNLLLRDHTARWKAHADDVNKKWTEGLLVTLAPEQVGDDGTKKPYQLGPDTPELRFAVRDTYSQRLHVHLPPTVFVLANTSENETPSKVMFIDENGSPSRPAWPDRIAHGWYSLIVLTVTHGHSGKPNPELKTIPSSFWVRNFRFELRDISPPKCDFVRWVPSGVGDSVEDSKVTGDLKFRICGVQPAQLLDPAKPTEAWLRENPPPDDPTALARRLTPEEIDRQIEELRVRLRSSH